MLPANPPIIVLGMHRSGTTLVARILTDLGIHMGEEVEENREAVAFLQTNNELLALAGSTWYRPQRFLEALSDDDFTLRCTELARRRLESMGKSYGNPSGASGWGFKDPRNSLTFPIWQACFSEVRAVHVLRHGFAVATSLFRRELRKSGHRATEGRMLATPGAAYRLWNSYVEAAERGMHIPGGPRMTIRYEDLLDRPEEGVLSLARLAGLPESDVASARRSIRQPSGKARWEEWWLRSLHRTGLLDTTRLESFGYDPAGLPTPASEG